MIRERQGRLEEAIALRERIYAKRAASPAELVRLGELQMNLGQTTPALASFEAARSRQGAAFAHHLELGVLYLAAGRPAEARESLDRVPPTHPGYPMALFKRAQVSVLLREPDAATRIQRARGERGRHDAGADRAGAPLPIAPDPRTRTLTTSANSLKIAAKSLTTSANSLKTAAKSLAFSANSLKSEAKSLAFSANSLKSEAKLLAFSANSLKSEAIFLQT